MHRTTSFLDVDLKRRIDIVVSVLFKKVIHRDAQVSVYLVLLLQQQQQ